MRRRRSAHLGDAVIITLSFANLATPPMPRKFLFAPDAYHSPTIAELRHQWRNIPIAEARNAVAVESQYLDFHRYLIAGIRHRACSGGEAIPLGLSLRAGALKAASLICASIAEAVLRAHAEVRGYPLPVKSWQKTFGRVLRSWQDKRARPHADIAAVWEELQRLHLGRNTIHLYRAAESGQDFYDVLAAERISLSEGERVLAHLREMRSDSGIAERAARWKTRPGKAPAKRARTAPTLPREANAKPPSRRACRHSMQSKRRASDIERCAPRVQKPLSTGQRRSE